VSASSENSARSKHEISHGDELTAFATACCREYLDETDRKEEEALKMHNREVHILYYLTNSVEMKWEGHVA
jgi:hypothetical protein